MTKLKLYEVLNEKAFGSMFVSGVTVYKCSRYNVKTGYAHDDGASPQSC